MNTASLDRTLQENIVSIVAKYLDTRAYRVVLFGSRAQGRGGDRSDIDIGIQGSQPVPLHTLTLIQEEIDALPTLHTIQIVDFARVSPMFRNVAQKTTVLL